MTDNECCAPTLVKPAAPPEPAPRANHVKPKGFLGQLVSRPDLADICEALEQAVQMRLIGNGIRVRIQSGSLKRRRCVVRQFDCQRAATTEAEYAGELTYM